MKSLIENISLGMFTNDGYKKNIQQRKWSEVLFDILKRVVLQKKRDFRK